MPAWLGSRLKLTTEGGEGLGVDLHPCTTTNAPVEYYDAGSDKPEGCCCLDAIQKHKALRVLLKPPSCVAPGAPQHCRLWQGQSCHLRLAVNFFSLRPPTTTVRTATGSTPSTKCTRWTTTSLFASGDYWVAPIPGTWTATWEAESAVLLAAWLQRRVRGATCSADTAIFVAARVGSLCSKSTALTICSYTHCVALSIIPSGTCSLAMV